jgi:hypothetical protein
MVRIFITSGRLFQDGMQRFERKVFFWVGLRDAARLGGMLELGMVASYGGFIPAILRISPDSASIS